ncbi:hypothetical protein BDZ94DRAFT_1146942, partial [Collybia nuda]
MLRVAKKYNVGLDPLSIPITIKNELPIWFHMGSYPNLNKWNNHYYSRCLLNKHKITKVGQMAQIANRTSNNHSRSSKCQCVNCSYDRQTLNCNNPAKCQETAIAILNCLHPKWNPLIEPETTSIPPLNPQQREANIAAFLANETITFDPS